MRRTSILFKLRRLIEKNNKKSEQEMLIEIYRSQLLEALSIEKLNIAWQIAKKEVDKEMAEKEADESKRLSLVIE